MSNVRITYFPLTASVTPGKAPKLSAHQYMGDNDVDPGYCSVCNIHRDMPLAHTVVCGDALQWEGDMLTTSGHAWASDGHRTVCLACDVELREGRMTSGLCSAVDVTMWR